MTVLSPTHVYRSFYLSVAGRTDVGRVRDTNEDAFVIADLTGGALLGEEAHARFDVGERGVLLAVSDGMGGAQAGEVASALVCETLTRALANASPDAPRDALMNDAVQRAHRASDDEIRNVVLELGRPEGIVHRLVDRANERGGKDNITVVVAGAGGDLAEPRASEPDVSTLEVLTAYDQHAPKTDSR